MLFALFCLDHPDKTEVRLAVRPQHIDYLDASGGLVKIAGPLLSDDGETMIGTLLVLDVANRAEAEAWSRSDPYAKAGLFKSVEIHPWRRTFGAIDGR